MGRGDARTASYSGAGLHRGLALEHETIKITDFINRIITVCLVHQAAIVPDHHVAGFPFVPVFELELSGMRQQSVEESQCILLLHPENFLDPDRIYVK